MFGRLIADSGKIKRWLVGRPIPTRMERHERLNVPLGIAVFASDALSSTAYATEEVLLALVGASFALNIGMISIPVALAICLLLAVVIVSYRQVTRAYPDGGGAYVVSKENLGPVACRIAGAALLFDYILTVSVSICAGVANLTSTGLLPTDWRLGLALWFVLGITLLNLRGLRESGKIIAVPAYLFILSMIVAMICGLWRLLAGGVPPSPEVVQVTAQAQEASMLLLILAFLKAFSHGCAALTGIESIANGVTAFRDPTVDRANRTMAVMGVILGSVFFGMTFLAWKFNITPSHTETVVSQVARIAYGGGHALATGAYYVTVFSTMIILILAANTSFAGYPRLASLLARDGLLPRQLMNQGDRLVFTNGILSLGLFSAILIWLFRGDTHALIPLYAVGVFLSFTLAQAGMIRHHLRHREPGWRYGMRVNSLGAAVTGVVTLILAIEKFTEGAWIVLVVIPVIILGFRQVERHYRSVSRQLALPDSGYCPTSFEHTALVLVSSLHRGTIPALEYAKTISGNVEAVHVELNPEGTARLKKAWHEWGCNIPLTILKSPYRSLTKPLMEYIDVVESRSPHNLVTIIVPEFVTRRWWHNFLHNQSAWLINELLKFHKGKVVTTVRFFLEE